MQANERVFTLKMNIAALADNIEKVIIGKRDVIKLVLTALLAKGHVLIEDIPGVGKTMLVNALAKSSGLSFSRIQCTPDMLPSDVTGFSLYNMNTSEQEYKKGPIMNQLVLADEINRTSPKTQSSLLEAMEEYQVSVDGVTHILPKPFMVLATQNPIECMGTYPLPEAQMDRFLLRITIGYPSAEQELCMMDRFGKNNPLDHLKAILSDEDILELQQAAVDIHISEVMKKYIINIINATRKHPDVDLGASPRATLSLMKAAQAYVLVSGGNYVAPEDIQYLAEPVLAHRLMLSTECKIKGKTQKQVIEEVLQSLKVPVE